MVRGNFRIRVDRDFHEMIEEICRELGVTHAQATRMIYRELKRGKCKTKSNVDMRLRL